MIKDLITDLKISAMDLKSEIRDVIHDITIKPPTTVQEDYSKLDRQEITVEELGYMNLGWCSAPAQMTASKIDMIADKISFVSEVIQQGLLAFDSIEDELQNCVRCNTPPQPQQLLSLASRIDSNQKQILMGLQKLKELSIEIDRATDKLQNNANIGWGNNKIGSW